MNSMISLSIAAVLCIYILPTLSVGAEIDREFRRAERWGSDTFFRDTMFRTASPKTNTLERATTRYFEQFATAEEPAHDPFSFSFSLGGGLDTNPLAEHKDGPDAWFYNPAFSATYSPKFSEPHSLDFEYQADATLYEGPFSEENSLDNVISATYAYMPPQAIVYDIALSGTHSYVDWEHFKSRVKVAPRIGYGWRTDWLLTWAQYEFAADEFATASSPAFDRDGILNAGGGSVALKLSRFTDGALEKALGNSALTLGFLHGFNRTDGTEFDYDASSINIGIKGVALIADVVSLNLRYSREWRDYKNESLLSSAGIRRDDDIDNATAVVKWALSDFGPITPNVFASYVFKQLDTNIEDVSFREQIIALGLEIGF